MRAILLRGAILAAIAGAVSPARAQTTLAGEREWPSEITRRPLTLGAGMLEAWVPLQFDLSTGADGKPVTLNPTLALGLTDQWMLGVRSVQGFCLGGASNGCGNVYQDFGAYTRISLGRGGGVDFAIQGGVDYIHIQEPTNWDAWGGVLLRFGGGALALTLAPQVSFGLKDRDTIASRFQPIAWNLGTYDVNTTELTLGNREWLSAPATLQFQLGPALAIAVGVSLEGPLNPVISNFSNEYRIPVGAALVLTPLKYLDLGASYTMPQLWGNHGTSDLRQLAVFIAFRT